MENTVYGLFAEIVQEHGDNNRPAFGEPPVVVNYFYHEEVKKSAKKDNIK